MKWSICLFRWGSETLTGSTKRDTFEFNMRAGYRVKSKIVWSGGSQNISAIIWPFCLSAVSPRRTWKNTWPNIRRNTSVTPVDSGRTTRTSCTITNKLLMRLWWCPVPTVGKCSKTDTWSSTRGRCTMLPLARSVELSWRMWNTTCRESTWPTQTRGSTAKTVAKDSCAEWRWTTTGWTCT